MKLGRILEALADALLWLKRANDTLADYVVRMIHEQIDGAAAVDGIVRDRVPRSRLEQEHPKYRDLLDLERAALEALGRRAAGVELSGGPIDGRRINIHVETATLHVMRGQEPAHLRYRHTGRRTWDGYDVLELVEDERGTA